MVTSPVWKSYTFAKNLFFSLEDLRQSESVSSFREEISRVSSEWSYEKQRLKNVIEDKEVSFQGLG